MYSDRALAARAQIALVAATLTASLGASVATVLLPTLARHFSVALPQVQWVMLAYLMSVTVAIVSSGRLGDLFGTRRILISGLVLFTAASLCCAVAPGLMLLIAARAVQGFAGAVLLALSMSLLRDLAPQGRLGGAMGLLGTTSALGTAFGPSLGGALLSWLGWRAAFWGLTGVAAVTLVLALFLLPHGAARTKARLSDMDLSEMDLLGTGFLIISLGIYGLATSGCCTHLAPLGVWIGAALFATGLFVLIERRATSPLVPMALLLDRQTGLGFAMNIVVGTMMMATLVVGPFYLTLALGLKEGVLGLVMAVGPAVSALSGVPAGRLTDHLGARRAIGSGLLTITLGLICFAVLPRVLGVTGYMLALVLLTPGFQLFLAANNTAVLATTAEGQRGRVSGLLGLSRSLGLMTGASAMPGLFTAFLHIPLAASAAAPAVAQAFSLTFLTGAALTLFTAGLVAASNQRQ